MSSKNLTIVWEVSSNFEGNIFRNTIISCGFHKQDTKGDYEISRWKGDGLTLLQFEKKIMIQGRYIDGVEEIIQKINALNGLDLDLKSKNRIQSIFKKSHGAITCEKCGKPHYLINTKVEGIDIKLYNECGHQSDAKVPFNMLIYRILPDLNILISNHLSRLINLNYLLNSEIVISDYVMNCTDHYLGNKNKNAISSEIEKLRKIKNEGKISLYYYSDKIPIPKNQDEYNKLEDDNILEIAKITNSILLTEDKNFKDKAILQLRPVIFLSNKVVHTLKLLSDIRTP